MGSTRKHRPRGRRAFSTGMGLTVFACLIGFFIISQIGYMDALTRVPVCGAMQLFLLGRPGRIDAVLDTMAAVGFAGMGLVAAMGLTSLVEKSWRLRDLILGIANTVIASLMICQWLVAWAFFHPETWQARAIMAIAPEAPVVYMDDLLSGWDRYADSPNWAQIAPKTYFNDTIGIYAREEVARTCFQADFIRANLKNIYSRGNLPNGTPIAALPDHALEKAERVFVFYDREGRYLSYDTYWDDESYPEMQKRNAERDEEGRQVDASEVWGQVMKSLFSEPEGELGPEEDVRPYTREEINAMVKATWDRDAPLPEE
ncbi:hypothetical protein [Hyphomonas beringensis]|nr:hypothetical protein [Hyphomonas beringensis]